MIGRMIRLLVAALLVIGVVALAAPTAVARPAAATGTNVCSQPPRGTTTWTAAGSPYRLCSSLTELQIAYQVNLVIDASQGPVIFECDDCQIVVGGGSLVTTHTSSADTVTFRGEDALGNPASWRGFAYGVDQRIYGYEPGGEISLSNSVILQAPFAAHRPAVTGSSVNLTSCYIDGAVYAGADTVSLQDDAIAGAVLIGELDQTQNPPEVENGAGSATVVGTTVHPPPGVSGIVIDADQIVAHGNSVDGQRGAEPAIQLTGQTSIGDSDDLYDNGGTDDDSPVVDLEGTSESGFSWPPTPAADGSSRVEFGLTGDITTPAGADVSVPDGLTVAANLTVGGTLTATDDVFVGPQYKTTDLLGSSGVFWNADQVSATGSDFVGGELGVSQTLTASDDEMGNVALNGGSLSGSVTGSVVGDLIFESTAGSSTLTATGDRFESEFVGAQTSGQLDDPAISAVQQATMSCDEFAGYTPALYSDTSDGPITVTDSNFDNDLNAITANDTVTASGNWWGQPGGPVAGENQGSGTVVTEPALSSPSTCADATPVESQSASDLVLSNETGDGVLSWSLPEGVDVTGVVVREQPGTIPPTATSGTQIYSGSGDSVDLGHLIPGAVSFAVFTSVSGQLFPGIVNDVVTVPAPAASGVSVTSRGEMLQAQWKLREGQVASVCSYSSIEAETDSQLSAGTAQAGCRLLYHGAADAAQIKLAGDEDVVRVQFADASGGDLGLPTDVYVNVASISALKASRPVVPVGGSTTLSGDATVSPTNGSGESHGRQVVLYREASGKVVSVAKSACSLDLSFSFVVRPARSTKYVAVADPCDAGEITDSLPFQAAESGAMVVSVKPSITERVTFIRSRAIVSGNVNPASKGLRVVLQQKDGGTWKVVKTAREAATGNLRFKLPINNERRELRILVPAGGSSLSGASRPIIIKGSRARPAK